MTSQDFMEKGICYDRALIVLDYELYIMNSMDYVNGQSIRIRFNNGHEPIQGDVVQLS